MLIRSLILVLMLGTIFGKCENSKMNSGLRLLMKLIEDCQKKGFVPCMKIKAITFLDRLERNNEIFLDEHVAIVRNSKFLMKRKILTEKQLEDELVRSNNDVNDSRLNDILYDRIADFFNNHKIVFHFPKIHSEDLSKEIEEGRGKMKKMMSMMMMGLAMKKAAMMPMVFGFLLVLAKKALIMSKLALIITMMSAMKKIRSPTDY